MPLNIKRIIIWWSYWLIRLITINLLQLGKYLHLWYVSWRVINDISLDVTYMIHPLTRYIWYIPWRTFPHVSKWYVPRRVVNDISPDVTYLTHAMLYVFTADCSNGCILDTTSCDVMGTRHKQTRAQNNNLLLLQCFRVFHVIISRMSWFYVAYEELMFHRCQWLCYWWWCYYLHVMVCEFG